MIIDRLSIVQKNDTHKHSTSKREAKEKRQARFCECAVFYSNLREFKRKMHLESNFVE